MASQLLDNHTQSIENVTLIPSAGGVFEVIAGGELIYSKKATGRHAEDGEVLGLFEEATGVEAASAD